MPRFSRVISECLPFQSWKEESLITNQNPAANISFRAYVKISLKDWGTSMHLRSERILDYWGKQPLRDYDWPVYYQQLLHLPALSRWIEVGFLQYLRLQTFWPAAMSGRKSASYVKVTDEGARKIHIWYRDKIAATQTTKGKKVISLVSARLPSSELEQTLLSRFAYTQINGLDWESILRREETGVRGENLRSTETQPTYNICCRGGRRDRFPTSTAQEIYPDGHPSRYQPLQQGLTSVNRREPVFPLVLAELGVGFGQSRSGRLITNSVYTWVSEWHICISESPQETRFYASRIHEFKNDKMHLVDTNYVV